MALIDDILALLPTGGEAEISAQDLRDIFEMFIPGYAFEGHDHVEADITDLDHFTATDANTAIDARVTKAFVDALNVDADTLDGSTAADFATDDHTHPGGGSFEFPVGYVYITVDPTNPNTVLGYGTWAAFGAGRMIVGFDSGQTEFDTVEETGGAKTVTLTAAQSGVPAHSHPMSGGSSDDTSAPFTGPDASTSTATAFGGGVGNNTPADAAQAHNNLPPYIVVHMFKRTA